MTLSKFGLSPFSFAVQGLENPSVQEFLDHPDYRQISTFFLGWVFFFSLQHLASSAFLRAVIPRVYTRLSRTRHDNPDDLEANKHSPFQEEKRWTPSWSAMRRDSEATTVEESSQQSAECDTFVFILTLCFSFASIAQFGSLLTFSLTGDSVCAFLVAWGGLAAYMARVVGLSGLVVKLRSFGIKRYETIACWIFLGVALLFVFLVNGISVGSVRAVQVLNTALCYRQHFLPTSLLASLIDFGLELYVLIRLWSFIVPERTHRTWLHGLGDIRVLRVLSLLFLEVLTMVPNAAPSTITGEFVPFSIGALAVLAAFNHRTVMPIPTSSVDSTMAAPGSSPPISRKSSPLGHVRQTGMPARESAVPFIFNHPFAGMTGNENRGTAPQTPGTAVSTWTMNSIAGMSVENAVVGMASRYPRMSSIPTVRVGQDPQRTTPQASPATAVRKSSAGEIWGNTARQTGVFGGIGVQVVQPTLEPPVRRATHRRDSSRKIVPDQVQYARQLEDAEDSRPPTGPIARPATRPRVSTSVLLSPAASRPLSSAITPVSAFYGSDIVRNSSKADRTKRQSAARSARSSLLSPSESTVTTMSPVRSQRRVSRASTLFAGSRLEPFAAPEVGHEPDTPSRAPTFGRAAFQRARYESSASTTFHPAAPMPIIRGLPGQPRLRASLAVRGPRLPPPAATRQRSLMPELDFAPLPIVVSVPTTPASTPLLPSVTLVSSTTQLPNGSPAAAQNA